MGSHCSFGHLKHKLWPKEGPGVKLPSPGHGESCVFVLPVARPSTKGAPTMH